MCVTIEPQIGRAFRFQLNGDDIGSFAGTGLLKSGETDLDSGVFPHASQDAIEIMLKLIKMRLDLFIGLVFERFVLTVVNPAGLAGIDLDLAIFLLAFTKFYPLFIRKDDDVQKLHWKL